MLQCGVSPKYILDEMSFYEMDALMENLYLVDKSDWERTRTLSYIVAQVNSKKKLSPEKIMKFPWDSESSGDHTRLTDAEVARLEEERKILEEKMRPRL